MLYFVIVMGCARRPAKRPAQADQAGYTIVEMVVAIGVLSIVVLSILQLFTALVNSALLMKQKGVALSLATSQMEYLKSLPYDGLAVSGGSIVAPSYIPAVTTQKISGTQYTITTSINYVDEAYDGCGAYPDLATKQKYCRNYPPPATAPATDTNPADCKVAHVKVSNPSGVILSDVDTQIAARVAETTSNTGALFVTVVDSDGSPLSGATVKVVNSTTTPTVNATDATDQNGMAIFYGLPPDSGYDYVINASLNGYSSLNTIPQSGSLQPYYKNVQIIAQQSSSITMQLRAMGQPSLLIESVDVNGNPVANVKLYLKGGYKKYTASTDTQYYYDNMSPTDVRVVTDASGIATAQNLTPGNYFICGDSGTTGCAVGGTQYNLAAAVPYGGNTALSPIVVPTYLPSSPPATTYAYNSVNYLQKVRVIVTPTNSYPRLVTLTPAEASLSASNISAFPFKLTGDNLPCGGSVGGCNVTVKLHQGANVYTANCSGTGDGKYVQCTVDLSGASVGNTYLEVIVNGNDFVLPSMQRAGIDVVS